MICFTHTEDQGRMLFRLLGPVSIISIGFLVSYLVTCVRDPSRFDDGFVAVRDVEDGITDASNVVMHQELVGHRPSMRQLLKPLLQAQCPGLFLCGPRSLTEDVQKAAADCTSIRASYNIDN
jgi:hypothetical protein